MNGDWLPPQQDVTLNHQLKVRCPQCFQSFRINTGEVHQARPKFACTKCESKFWLPFPESLKQKELIGFPLSWIESAPESKKHPEKTTQESTPVSVPRLETFECPSCGYDNTRDELECKKCGVVFEKIMARAKDQEEGVVSTPLLRKKWKQILDDFENDDLHEDFLLECQRLNCLNFASRRYSQLGEAVGTEPIIDRMMERVNTLSQQKLAHLQQSNDQERTAKLRKFSWFNLSNFILFCALVVTAVGFAMPETRNLIGVGAALGFLSLAARFTFR